MLYKKFKVDISLSDFIECIYIWEGDAGSGLDIESPPNAYTSIVLNYGNPYKVSTVKGQNKPIPNCFISGQATRNYTLHLKGKIQMAGIVMKPCGIYHFLKIPMKTLNDERRQLSQYLPKFSNNILCQLKAKSEISSKVILIEDLIQKLFKKGANAHPRIIEASNHILDEKGNIDIQELIEKTCMSRRTFERKFSVEVGVSPKMYAKIRRFGYVCSIMARSRNVNFADILFRGGYYDQSHFIKDFKYFSGRTPKLYNRTNNELAHFVKETFFKRL